MRICIISDLYPPEVIGGAEKHAADDCTTLAKNGHDVHVITTGTEAPVACFETKKVNGVNVHRFKPANAFSVYNFQNASFPRKFVWHAINMWNPHSISMVKRKIQDVCPEIIHVHNYRGLSTGVFKAVASAGVPVVHTLHDYASLHPRSNLFKDGEPFDPGSIAALYYKYNDRIISRYVDLIIAPSKFVIDKHQEFGMFNNLPHRVVRHGVEEVGDHNQQTNPRDISRVLYVGQLTDTKGVELLINSISDIDSDHIQLDILGKGPDQEHIKSMAEESENIVVHGYVSEDELHQKYVEADFTVVPSRWYEVAGLVIYESFAHNTPVIGADIGGIPELINEGKNGYLFEPNSRVDLKNTIINHLSESDYIADNIGDQQRSIETHVNELEECYNELVR